MRRRPRILIVTGRPPWPPWRGDQLRTRQWAAALHSRYDVTVLSPSSQPQADDADWPGVEHHTFETSPRALRVIRATGAVLRGLPGQCGLYRFPDLTRKLRELAPQHDGAILLLARLALHAEDLGQIPWAADLIDSLSLSFARRARYDRGVLRPLWRLESHLLDRAERRLAGAATTTVLVSRRDADHLVSRLPSPLRARIAVVPVAPPTGGPAPTVSLVSPQPTLAFTGNLGYFVNEDALTWWLRAVWPTLRVRRPELRLLVAGARPSQTLEQSVAAAGGQLHARPPDLRALLASCTVAVAPLRAGAGMPLKVLDAWSVGVPLVASTWAAAGVEGVAGRDLEIADTPAEWVDAIERILASPEHGRRLATGGRRSLAERYAEGVVYDGLRRIADGILEPTASQTPEASTPR